MDGKVIPLHSEGEDEDSEELQGDEDWLETER